METQTATAIPVLKTPYRVDKEAKELAIYKEYNDLMSKAGQSATAVVEYLMEKHNIHSASTIYLIRKRVEERLKTQEGER